ncbi:hypothetical protein MNBD_GAMMA10-507 [hydrothermal vent metagenome]|uniref:Uncharacterized protein n=1 Tax=hydrothermal vent metagenome TaxID=652676 RepID=A0A3B0XNL5_9ZZZZ
MNTWVPNLEGVNRFKQRINYPKIIQHITDEKKVQMKWSQVLKKIDISSASAWVSYKESGSVLSGNHAKFSDFFENGKKNINIQLHVFTGLPNKAVIEKAVLLTGYASAPDIKKEYSKNGPGDFYLYSRHSEEGTGDRSAICVFKNIVLVIKSIENDVDVRSVAKLLVDLMSNSLVKNNEIPEISYNTLQSAQKVKTGDTFWVDIQFSSGNYPDDYDVDLPIIPIPEGMEYVKNDESKYYLKASQPGTYQFDMWVMDKRTLITNTVTFDIIVKD